MSKVINRSTQEKADQVKMCLHVDIKLTLLAKQKRLKTYSMTTLVQTVRNHGESIKFHVYNYLRVTVVYGDYLKVVGCCVCHEDQHGENENLV